MIVFGSFTEDEIRSLNSKPSEDSATPVGKTELQFGSLPLVSGVLLNGTNGETGKKLFSSVKPSNSVKKDAGSVHSKALVPGSGDVLKENGSIYNSEHIIPLSNGMKQIKVGSPDLASACLTDNDGTVLSQQTLTPPQGRQSLGLKERDANGVHGASQKLVSLKDDLKKASNGSIATMGDLLPRGLINAGNSCFINATLQALLSCSPFLKLLQDLRTRDIPKVDYPTLIAFVDFVSEFDMPHGSSSKTKDSSLVETGRPFSPAMFEGVVKNFTPDVASDFYGWTRQEDAQEFLSFVMDRMHDELLKLSGMDARKLSLVSSSEDDDEWETVGRKNKSAVTRTQSFVPSELSAIFGGELRSVVKTKGNKDSATIQPYLLLHLDILSEAVNTIEDALRLYCAPETVEGYRASNTSKAGVVPASKSIKIRTLSKIMILHLMRFTYKTQGTQGSTKVHKPVHFPLELVLSSQLLVSPKKQGRKYELVATITHHGRDPSKGHYTADTRHPDGQWLRFDDASVMSVPTSKVLHDQAYVLFYKQV